MWKLINKTVYSPSFQTLVIRGLLSETLKNSWPPGYNIVPKVKRRPKKKKKVITLKLFLIFLIFSRNSSENKKIKKRHHFETVPDFVNFVLKVN